MTTPSTKGVRRTMLSGSMSRGIGGTFTTSIGEGYNEDPRGNRTPLTDEQRAAFEKALARSLNETKDME